MLGTVLTLDSLLALERRGWDALSNGTGAQFYSDVMSEDGLMLLVDGSVMTHSDVTASLSGAPTWDSYDITDPQLLSLSQDAAVLVYRAKATRGDDVFVALMSSTYAMVDGEPKLKCYQQTASSVT